MGDQGGRWTWCLSSLTYSLSVPNWYNCICCDVLFLATNVFSSDYTCGSIFPLGVGVLRVYFFELCRWVICKLVVLFEAFLLMWKVWYIGTTCGQPELILTLLPHLH